MLDGHVRCWSKAVAVRTPRQGSSALSELLQRFGLSTLVSSRSFPSRRGYSGLYVIVSTPSTRWPTSPTLRFSKVSTPAVNVSNLVLTGSSLQLTWTCALTNRMPTGCCWIMRSGNYGPLYRSVGSLDAFRSPFTGVDTIFHWHQNTPIV